MSTRKSIKLAATPEARVQRKFAKAGVIAPRLGIHKKTIFRWADAGRISRYKLNDRVVLFDEAEIEKLIDDSRIVAGGVK